MKKFFTLVTMALMALTASAQVVLTDPAGKEYADGETMVIYADYDEMWDEYKFKSPVIVNKGNAAVSVSLEYDVKTLPEGTSFQDCYSGECRTKNSAGIFKTSAMPVAANNKRETAIEWLCYGNDWNVVYGEALFCYTLYVGGEKGATVRVIYNNPDPAGINGVNADVANASAGFYTVNGVKAANGTKGIVLQRMANGSVKKVAK